MVSAPPWAGGGSNELVSLPVPNPIPECSLEARPWWLSRAFLCGSESMPSLPGPGELLYGRLVSGQASHNLSHRRAGPVKKPGSRRAQNYKSAFCHLSPVCSPLPVLAMASSAQRCSLQHLERQVAHSLPSLRLEHCLVPQHSPRLQQDPGERPESGHQDRPIAQSLVSTERLRNPSSYVFVLLISYKILKTYINTESLNNQTQLAA